MSGRSAYVRKKITQTKKDDGSFTKHAHEDVEELPSPRSAQERPSFGNGSPPFSKFSDFGTAADLARSPTGSSGSAEGRKWDSNPKRPLDDFAYARARKPSIKSEDMTGIEKSGMRSAYDKRSEDIRKGLSKAFGFGNKKAKRHPNGNLAHDAPGSGPFTEHDQLPHPHPPSIYELPADSSAGPPTLPPPTTGLPPLPPGPQIRRWIGSGRPVQRWNKLRKDPELWDNNGDVLIYLAPKGHNRLDPSFRLSSHIIEATCSRHLITMLREGVMEDFSSLPPPGQPIPDSDDLSAAAADGQISYEIYFPPPSNASKIDQIRHQLATRNVFAVLCHVSLVGLSLHQALSDLLARLEQYLPEGPNETVLTIMSYLSARGIDDVRNDAEAAVGLLAWSEDPKVRWEEAWRESFVHAAGLYGSSRGRATIESCADFKSLSPITRALLERASLETQLRVQGAEERLASFSFGEMWPMSITPATFSGALLLSPAKDTADRLQQFFIRHYRTTYGGRWPPSPPQAESSDEAIWLTRTLTMALQKDFGALYEYLVDRDIIWDMSESRASRKWLMVSDSGNKAFQADTVDLPMTDILIEFDNGQRYPHIPHPYPLVPESVPVQLHPPGTASTGTTLVSNGSGSSMNFLKRNRTNPEFEPISPPPTSPLHHRPGPLERRVLLAYTESTNVYMLGSDFTESALIDAFVKFEKSDRIGEVDPSLARRARWVLIYGILQTLAAISVDAPCVRYREGVSYHLSPQLKGARIPPWTKKIRSPGPKQYLEAAHDLSHCWMAPQRWTAANASGNTSEDDGPDEEGAAAAAAAGASMPNPASPPLSLDQERLVPWPPPLAHADQTRNTAALMMRYAGILASTNASTRAPTTAGFSMASSVDGGDPARTASTRSTTRATTPMPMPQLSRTNSTLARNLSLRTNPSLSTMTPTKTRVDESMDASEWEPVRRGRAGGGASEVASTAGSDSASTTHGRSRGNTRKNSQGALLGVEGLVAGGNPPAPNSSRPRSRVVPDVGGPRSQSRAGSTGSVPGRALDEHGWDLEEEGDAGEENGGAALTRGPKDERGLSPTTPLGGRRDGVVPVIWDFDALDVDDIMPC